MLNQFNTDLYEYTLVSKLEPYLPVIQDWWLTGYTSLNMSHPGLIQLDYDTEKTPAGIMIRVCNAPSRSIIKNVQAFPVLATSQLNISGVAGGATNMIEAVCRKGLEINGLTIIEKHNLPSVFNSRQFLAFVPTRVMQCTEYLGKYIYLSSEELHALAHGRCVKSVSLKCKNYL